MNIRRPAHKTGLDDAINDLLAELKGHTGDTKEYSATTKQLTRLYELKLKERPERVSKDTMLLVAGNLLGILVIVGHERAHIVTSKALSLLAKTR